MDFLSILKSYDPIGHGSKLPINQQLMSRLESILRDKRLKAGDKLPSIRQLTEHFKISQLTVQQALNELALRKYIVKRHGSGCFVSKTTKRPKRTPSFHVSIPVFKPSEGDDFTQPISNMLAGSVAGLSECGFSASLVDCREDGSEFIDICNQYRNGLTDGVILHGYLPNLEINLKEAQFISMPVIMANQFNENICNITADIKKAAKEMVENLIGLGMKHVSVCTIKTSSPRFKEITDGIAETMNEKNIPFPQENVHLFSDKTICIEDAVKDIISFLKNSQTPDVIFSSPEVLTFAVAEALKATENNNTKLVSVGSAIDSYTFFSSQRVLRIKTPYFEMGRHAGKHIAYCIKNGMTPKAEQIKTDCKIIK